MNVFLALELVGTIAFAVSGAIVGIQKKMDIFGVAILGLTTAVGGGILRDLILNITPPAAFRDPVFAITAIFVSIITFIKPTLSSAEKKRSVYEKILLIMDSVGLGLFTVIGIQVAKTSYIETNLFLETFVGVLTGVGGGLLRDVFAGYTPSIFVKHFYACASIVGAWICVLLWPFLGAMHPCVSEQLLLCFYALWQPTTAGAFQRRNESCNIQFTKIPYVSFLYIGISMLETAIRSSQTNGIIGEGPKRIINGGTTYVL